MSYNVYRLGSSAITINFKSLKVLGVEKRDRDEAPLAEYFSSKHKALGSNSTKKQMWWLTPVILNCI